MERILAIILPIVFLVVLGVGGNAIIGALAVEADKAEIKAVRKSVFVEVAETRDVQLIVMAQGTVKPSREINLSPQITGKIDYVSSNFADGGFIKKGETLIRLEQDDYELSLINARAGVASAQQRLARERAESELARQDLLDLGYSNASDLALRKPQLAEAQAALDSAKAQLADAELALKRTVIKAPFTGIVSQQAVDIGEFVSPGQMLGRIYDTSVFEIYLPIQDSEFSKLGIPVSSLSNEALDSPIVELVGNVGNVPHTWKGKVVRTGAGINQITRQIGIFVEVEDPYGAGASNGTPLPVGLFVDARILGRTLTNAIVIPRTALRSLDTVYVTDGIDGLLSIRQVDVVQTNSDEAVILSGVSAGEFVITSLIDSPTNGTKLSLLQTLADGTVAPIPLENADTQSVPNADDGVNEGDT